MVTPPNNSYAPPKSVVADVEPDGEVKAGRGVRLGAAMIDSLIIFAPLIPAYVKAWPLLLSAAGGPRNAFAAWGIIASTGVWFYFGVFCAVIVLVINGMLAHANGQTIAKKWLGIKDVRTDGSRVSFARIFWLRNALSIAISFVPVVGSLYGLVDALFIFGSPKRCVHDYLADTIVIRA